MNSRIGWKTCRYMRWPNISVVKAYGGTASKALFVTDAKMTDVAKKKCEQYGMMAFSLQEPHLMENRKGLSLMLDAELFNINTK